jgi:hypothetical protein
MRYRVSDEGETVDFTFGQRSSRFELGFDAGSLREFVKVGIKALRELDALHDERTGAANPDSAAPCTGLDARVS